jgi:hypothetical protein
MTAKRSRHSREDLRELLLRTGRTILYEEGLGSGAESLTFKRVFDRVEDDAGIRLTNASVIRRVWENQAEFQIDVLVTIALDESRDDIELALKNVGPVFAAIDRSSPESRAAGLRELCRVGGAANAESLLRSSTWPSWISVWALAATSYSGTRDDRIESALRRSYETFTAQIQRMYEALTSFLGYRLREEFTYRQFVIAADSLGQGYGLRVRVDHSVSEVMMRSTGPGGQPEEWTLFAVAFEGLLHQFFEIDPAWRPGDGAVANAEAASAAG